MTSVAGEPTAVRTADHLNVSEWFGPTIQGEGRNTGQLASFLRLSGCNLTCSWCDSPYTWDWSRFNRAAEVHKMAVSDLAQAVDALPGRLVVTGGEPLLQATGLAHLFERIRSRPLDLETNGTRPLGRTAGWWDTISCSPKVGPSAGQDQLVASRLDPSVAEVADFKFVVADEDDLAAVDAFTKEAGLAPHRVWLMPEGTDTDTLTSRMPFIMEAATKRGTNVSGRLHVYGWGDSRGH